MDGRFQPRQRSQVQRNQGQRNQDFGDRRLDQWIETGRQLVDGVAGTRPGRRPTGGGRPSMDLETVGRWVGDKIDWLMDEEEDWRDPVEPPMPVESPAASSRKRPLDAISRRRILASVPEPESPFQEDDNSWPDDESFRVERWSRSASSPLAASRSESSAGMSQPLSRGSSRRPLPRSSRRRD